MYRGTRNEISMSQALHLRARDGNFPEELTSFRTSPLASLGEGINDSGCKGPHSVQYFLPTLGPH